MNNQYPILTLGDLAGKTENDVRDFLVGDFEASVKEVDKFDILIAQQNEDGYEGSACFLLREKSTGELFEAYGSHCSCMGYEGQFKPEATNIEYLLSDKSGYFNNNETVKNWVRKYLA